MTVLRAPSGPEPALFGQEGELISVQISVEPRLLEDLLDTLARVDFPVNPQLYHQTARVKVEFPAYSNQIDRLRQALQTGGFDADNLELSRVLARAAH